MCGQAAEAFCNYHVIFLTGMALQNNEKWTEVKDVYPKQRHKIYHKAKVQIYCSCTEEVSMSRAWHVVRVYEV